MIANITSWTEWRISPKGMGDQIDVRAILKPANSLLELNCWPVFCEIPYKLMLLGLITLNTRLPWDIFLQFSWVKLIIQKVDQEFRLVFHWPASNVIFTSRPYLAALHINGFDFGEKVIRTKECFRIRLLKNWIKRKLKYEIITGPATSERLRLKRLSCFQSIFRLNLQSAL